MTRWQGVAGHGGGDPTGGIPALAAGAVSFPPFPMANTTSRTAAADRLLLRLLDAEPALRAEVAELLRRRAAGLAASRRPRCDRFRRLRRLHRFVVWAAAPRPFRADGGTKKRRSSLPGPWFEMSVTTAFFVLGALHVLS